MAYISPQQQQQMLMAELMKEGTTAPPGAPPVQPGMSPGMTPTVAGTTNPYAQAPGNVATPPAGAPDPRAELMRRIGQSGAGLERQADAQRAYAQQLRGTDHTKLQRMGDIVAAPTWAHGLRHAVSQGLGGYMSHLADEKDSEAARIEADARGAEVELGQLNQDKSDAQADRRLSETERHNAEMEDIYRLRAERDEAYRTARDKDQYIGTAPERKAVEGAIDDVAALDDLRNTFKDEYGAESDELGFLARMKQIGYTYEPGLMSGLQNALGNVGIGDGATGKFVNSRTGETLEGEELAAAREKFYLEKQNWWRKAEARYNRVQRYKYYGATLTDNEKTTFESGSFNPGMGADQVRLFLDTMHGATSRGMDRKIAAAEAKGWSTDVLDFYRGQSELYGYTSPTARDETTEALEGMPPEEAQAVLETASVAPPPAGISQSDWDTYSPELRLRTLNAINRGMTIE